MEGFRGLENRLQRTYYQWSLTQGLLCLTQGYEAQMIDKDVSQLLRQSQSTQKPSVYILVDFYHCLKCKVIK